MDIIGEENFSQNLRRPIAPVEPSNFCPCPASRSAKMQQRGRSATTKQQIRSNVAARSDNDQQNIYQIAQRKECSGIAEQLLHWHSSEQRTQSSGSYKPRASTALAPDRFAGFWQD
jgi:hypothetical protein